jgi:general stress protein 26
MATSLQNQQLVFLQERIRQIGSAIFFNQSDSILKLPTSLVNTLLVDDYGYVWFFVKKPKQYIQEFEKGFPARLDFFKKGVDYFLQVTGKGSAVSDPEELQYFLQQQKHPVHPLPAEMVLVKVKILKAEYFETSARLRSSPLKAARHFLANLFNLPGGVGQNTYYPAS